MTDQIHLGWSWASSGTTIDPGEANYEMGWVIEIPTYQEMNYVLHKVDNNILALAEKGSFGWDASINYQAGAEVWSNGVKLISKIANTNQDPLGDLTQSYWVKAPVFGKAADQALPKEGLALHNLVTKYSNTWGGTEITLYNQTTLINFAVASSSYVNWLFGNVEGKLVAIDVGNNVSPDTRPISLTDEGVYEVFHKGNPPTIEDVGEGLGENPIDGHQYLRKNSTWVIQDKATASDIAAGGGGDINKYLYGHITPESLENSGVYATKSYVDSNASSFAPGTTMVFVQASAPVGWSRVSSYDYRQLTVRSVGGQIGGTDSAEYWQHTHSTNPHRLTEDEMPRHKHRMTWGSEVPGPNGNSTTPDNLGASGNDSNNYQYDSWSTGGNSTHSHGNTGSTAYSPKYVSSIVCVKN